MNLKIIDVDLFRFFAVYTGSEFQLGADKIRYPQRLKKYAPQIKCN
jgi:hypothetical protein